jgi:hypothetical protein
MKFLLIGVVGLGLITILYLLRELRRSKKEIFRLQEISKARRNTIEHLNEHDHGDALPVDALATHDKVIEMSKSGETVEVISERLKIPQSKVKMTLKFEKIKKDGTR